MFLFDEPLSNLDAMLRVQMRVEIAKLHKDLSATMIYVTHDQVEAMTLADKIVVLDHGVISQVGSPMELYLQPENKFVASFIGSPTMNFVSAKTKANEGGNITVELPGGHGLTAKTRHGGKTANGAVEIGIRPEHIRLAAAGDPAANLPGTVQILERLGNATIMYVDTPAGQIVVQDDGDAPARSGENVGVVFDPARVHLFNAESEGRLRDIYPPVRRAFAGAPVRGAADRGAEGRWPAEQVALNLVALLAAEDGKLVLGLDAFGGRRQIERPGQLQDGADDGVGLVRTADAVEEAAVDLDLVEGQRLQYLQRRVAGAEIVEDDMDAEGAERGEGPARHRHVLDDSGFSDLEVDAAGIDAARRHGGADSSGRSRGTGRPRR